jgi:organic hydroperoxide reductase OsmC/OhrA
MAGDTVHEVRVTLSRERPPIRRARLEITGEEVVFGVPGWQGDHYGFPPGSVEEHPGTLDYLVASVAGCLIGTFGGALRARGIASEGDALTAEALGAVVVEDDGVLRLRRIVVRYRLKAPESQRAAAERAHTHHARHCPNARSVAAAIDIVTELDFVPVAEPAPATA